MPESYHENGHSIDNTLDYLKHLQKEHDNIFVKTNEGNLWQSKDHMVNRAIDVIKEELKIRKCYLWQIDVDEQWEEKKLFFAENALEFTNVKTGLFLCDYWVGKNLIVRGDWGESRLLPYRRLWNWAGEYFRSHEPPTLDPNNGRESLLPFRFDHYAYYFDKDVLFKDAWYNGYKGIYEKWLDLQQEAKDKPIGYEWPVTKLLRRNSYWGRTKTVIVKVKYD
jgi:hypothetical protein